MKGVMGVGEKERKERTFRRGRRRRMIRRGRRREVRGAEEQEGR
jgi:hypothetical protein